MVFSFVARARCIEERGHGEGSRQGTYLDTHYVEGAIRFGLVHIPVGLYSATASSGVDFDWLDRRSMEPVGYKRVNKVTGQEIAADDIIKGVEL